MLKREDSIVDRRHRKQTEDALRQSEANYRNLVQTANSVIIRFDTQGRIQYLNDYGQRFFGYEEHQILGRTLRNDCSRNRNLWTRSQTTRPQFISQS